MGHKTLEEVLTRVKPEVVHFYIFKCLVHIHVPLERRTKLEPLIQNDIFVGYNETSKAYKVYILSQGKTMVSRDVIFEEHRALTKSNDTILMADD